MHTIAGLRTILDEPLSREMIRKINLHTREWALQVLKKHHYGKPDYEPTREMFALDACVNSWTNPLGLLGGGHPPEDPFEVTKHLMQIGVDLTKDMIDTGNYDYQNHPKYKQFLEEWSALYEELIKNPDWQYIQMPF